MMNPTRVASALKTLDDMAALARAVANPEAIAELQAEFEEGLKQLNAASDALAKTRKDAEAALTASQSLRDEVTAREGIVTAQEQDLKRGKDILAAREAAHESAKQNTVRLSRENEDRIETKAAQAKAEADAKAKELADREASLVAREKSIAENQAFVDDARKEITKLQQEAKGTISKYNRMIKKLQDAASDSN